MKLYLVRHGQTDWNKKGIYQGKTDVILNQDGKNQALEVKEKLKYKKIDLCICSPLQRAIQTAIIITDRKIPIFKSSLLIERNLGIYEASFVGEGGYDSQYYWDYALNSDKNGVEPVRNLFKRAELFLDYLQEHYENKNILIVAHGAIIRAIHYQIIGYSEDEKFLDFDVSNCCLFEYDL